MMVVLAGYWGRWILRTYCRYCVSKLMGKWSTERNVHGGKLVLLAVWSPDAEYTPTSGAYRRLSRL